MHKEVKEVIDKAKLIGYTLDGMNGNGHYILTATNGGKVILPSTPGDWRSTQNAISEMERRSGRKLPRQQSGKHRHYRTRIHNFERSNTEQTGIARRDRLTEEAASLRDEFMQSLPEGQHLGESAPQSVKDRARHVAARHQKIKEVLEQDFAHLIPGLSL